MYKSCGFLTSWGLYIHTYFANFKSDYCYILILCIPSSSNIIKNKRLQKLQFHNVISLPAEQIKSERFAKVIPGFRLEKGCIITRCHVPSVSIIVKRSVTKFSGKYIASVNDMVHACVINQV